MPRVLVWSITEVCVTVVNVVVVMVVVISDDVGFEPLVASARSFSKKKKIVGEVGR